MVPIRVSRSGLTRCPGCKVHVKLAAKTTDTVCPFCETSLTQGGASISALLSRSRGTLLAASLLASTALGACADDEGSSPSDVSVTDAASDTAADTTADGLDTGPDVEIIEDVINVAEYGMPPDAQPLPPYGIPPDGF